MIEKTEAFKTIRRALIQGRFLARVQIENYSYCSNILRAKRRAQSKLKHDGITFIPLEGEIYNCRQLLQEAHRHIVDSGEMLFTLLDGWQETGATLKDLCDLCAKPYHLAVQEIKDEPQEQFSGIMFVHRLDYQHDFTNCGWYRDEVDAPFSRCIMEYMLHLMETDPIAKAASDEAFQEVFPEIWEKAFYIQKDEDGNEKYYDRDGLEINPAEI
jgi:hypothetical protein